MAVFRFLSVFLILILLLGIVLENLVDRKEKPIIFIANDNSESVVSTKDSLFYKNDFIPQLQELSDALTEDFEVINYTFSGVIEEGLKQGYIGKTTNISLVFEQIFEQYTNRNIGGIVLASDGIYNVGSNPIYTLTRKSFIPVFSVGLGDTNKVKDVKIEFVKHNEIVFVGNDFPVEVGIDQSQYNGQEVKVGIYKNDKLLQEKQLKFNRDNQQLQAQFELKAGSVGFQKYTIKVSELADEFTTTNNVRDFYIEVIDGRQKILIAHNGPHPDISAIRFVIENNKNYEVEVKQINEVSSLKAYDLVIIHNYSSENNSINDAIASGSTPCLFIIGNRSEVTALSRAKIGFSGTKTDLEEVSFKHNTAFKEILLSPKVIELLSSAPPLQSPFGDFKFSAANEVLAYQKIGSITLEKPLIYFNRKNNSRFGVIMGEGIWRWRLQDQLQNSTTENFEEFMGKLITYLAVKDNKDPFRIHAEKIYNENQSVVVKAELYNKSFELINEPEVIFEYTDENEKSFSPHFLRSANSYQLDLGKMKSGLYSWKASTEFQGKNYIKKGSFLVKEINIEQLNIEANHRLLRNMSDNSGGNFYFPNEMADLKTELLNRDDMVTVVYQEKTFDDLIDYKILLFLVLLLLSIEWFFRKYNGAY